MNDERYSLNNLREIVVPEPPPFWPPAPGVWIVLGVAAALTLIVCWRLYAAWIRNAYRRAGLALLQDAKTIHELSVLLKRVALAAFPREEVASLYGQDWVAFLGRTCPGRDFTELLKAERDTRAPEPLFDASRNWIKHHSPAQSAHARPRAITQQAEN